MWSSLITSSEITLEDPAIGGTKLFKACQIIKWGFSIVGGWTMTTMLGGRGCIIVERGMGVTTPGEKMRGITPLIEEILEGIGVHPKVMIDTIVKAIFHPQTIDTTDCHEGNPSMKIKGATGFTKDHVVDQGKTIEGISVLTDLILIVLILTLDRETDMVAEYFRVIKS
jgi:hypothetical protein